MSSGGKGKGPKAPDYAALAKLQGKEDRKTAEAITASNRPDQYDALGNSTTWTKDASGKWTQNQNWSPEVQKQFQQQIAASGTAGELQNAILANLRGRGQFSGPDMPQYDERTGRAVSNATYNAMTARTRPEQQRSQEALSNKLRLQGLEPGTEGYDRAMRNMMTSHADADALAAERATIAGYDEARQQYMAQLQGQNQDFTQNLTEYNLPWQEAQMAQSMAADRYVPTMPGFSGATGYNAPDYLGAATAQHQAKVSQQNASNQKKGSTLGAGATLGSAAIMASDADLKDNIEKLDGKQALEDLLEIGGHSWTWKEDGSPDVGVIAQNVKAVMESAVNEDLEYMRVNYTMLVGKCIAALEYLSCQ